MPGDHETSCSSHSCGNQDSGFRLPVIQIPSFDGTYFKWLEFHDTYVSLIHNNERIKPIHKFHYLCSYLEGEAARIICNLEISENNYTEAWSLLCERYNNKRQLINNHLNALFKMDSISRESDKSLRFLVDHVSKHLRALHNLGQPTDKWDTLIIHIMASKLDTTTNLKWEEHRNSLPNSEMPTLNEFQRFLKSRADVLESVLISKQGKGNPTLTSPNNNSYNLHKTYKSYVVTANPSQVFPPYQECFCCKGQPRIYDCPTFMSLNTEDRIRKAVELKLCLNCLRSGHPASSCQLSSCRIC